METEIQTTPQAPSSCQCNASGTLTEVSTWLEAHNTEPWSYLIFRASFNKCAIRPPPTTSTAAFMYYLMHQDELAPMAHDSASMIDDRCAMMEARVKELEWLEEFGSLDFDNDLGEADEDVYEDDDDFPDDSSMPDLAEVGENVRAPRRRRVKPPRRRRHHRGETPEFVRRMMPRAYQS